MRGSRLNWSANRTLVVGKGATTLEFFARFGSHRFEIDVAPWGEGHLKLDGREIGHIEEAKDRRRAFRQLKLMADRYLKDQASAGQSRTH